MREPRVDQAAIDFGGFGGGLNHAPGDGGDDKADEKDQRRADHVGHIIDEALHQGIERHGDARQTWHGVLQLIQRRNQADQPHHPITDLADPLADIDGRLFPALGAVAARQERDPVHPLGDRPFDRLGGEMRHQQDGQRDDDVRGVEAKRLANLSEIHGWFPPDSL